MKVLLIVFMLNCFNLTDIELVKQSESFAMEVKDMSIQKLEDGVFRIYDLLVRYIARHNITNMTDNDYLSFFGSL